MDWLQILDIAGKFLTELAIVGGGGWVLYNYERGRTHSPRLQLRVSAERVFRNGLEYLLIRTELSNVGLARVNIVNDGCALRVFAGWLPARVESVMEPEWERLGTFDLFGDQHWVEPSGLLIDQQLVALPGVADKFAKIWAHVESKKVAWNADVVIAPRA